MKNGKTIWVSQPVIDHLDKILGDRAGGGVFDRESYNAVLMELLELEPYEKESDADYDVSMLKVGERRSFMFGGDPGRVIEKRVKNFIGKYSARTGREYNVQVYWPGRFDVVRIS